jgi:hypothetical protein
LRRTLSLLLRKLLLALPLPLPLSLRRLEEGKSLVFAAGCCSDCQPGLPRGLGIGSFLSLGLGGSGSGGGRGRPALAPPEAAVFSTRSVRESS